MFNNTVQCNCNITAMPLTVLSVTFSIEITVYFESLKSWLKQSYLWLFCITCNFMKANACFDNFHIKWLSV